MSGNDSGDEGSDKEEELREYKSGDMEGIRIEDEDGHEEDSKEDDQDSVVENDNEDKLSDEDNIDDGEDEEESL